MLHSLLGSLGGDWGREILYLGLNDILYTHLGCFSARGGAGGDGRAFLHVFQMSVFPIRQVVPVGLPGFAPGLFGLGFSYKKSYIIVATTYLHTMYCFINLWVGERGWMAEDGFGCRFPN